MTNVTTICDLDEKMNLMGKIYNVVFQVPQLLQQNYSKQQSVTLPQLM